VHSSAGRSDSVRPDAADAADAANATDEEDGETGGPGSKTALDKGNEAAGITVERVRGQ
jgi:hypothetical protein